MTFNIEAYQPDYDWHDSVFEMAKEAAKVIGIDIDEINYSGFCSQGDGASFTGCYSYAKGGAAAIRKDYPKTTELHRIADELQKAQRPAFYKLTATIERGRYGGNYSHSRTMSVDISTSDDSAYAVGEWDKSGVYRPAPAEEVIRDALRSFADWIYDALEQEYEYQQAWQLARGWEDAGTEAQEERQVARELIRDIRQVRKSPIAAPHIPPTICSALRASVRAHLSAAVEKLEERAAIADAFHYWDDGKRLDVATFAASHL